MLKGCRAQGWAPWGAGRAGGAFLRPGSWIVRGVGGSGSGSCPQKTSSYTGWLFSKVIEGQQHRHPVTLLGSLGSADTFL